MPTNDKAASEATMSTTPSRGHAAKAGDVPRELAYDIAKALKDNLHKWASPAAFYWDDAVRIIDAALAPSAEASIPSEPAPSLVAYAKEHGHLPGYTRHYDGTTGTSYVSAPPPATPAEASTPAARDEDAGAGDALHRKILDALRIYRCQHAQYDDDGGGCQLVDVFTPHDDQNIAKGQEELELLADHLWSELLSISPAPPPAEGEVLVWLDEIESDNADVLARLDEIEARANAASEGPWSQGDTEEHGSGRDDAVYLPNDDWLCDPMACVEDAAFIAHARQDIPWLIAQLRARIAGGAREGKE